MTDRFKKVAAAVRAASGYDSPPSTRGKKDYLTVRVTDNVRASVGWSYLYHYTDGPDSYELAFLLLDGGGFTHTPRRDQVRGHLTLDEVCTFVREVVAGEPPSDNPERLNWMDDDPAE